MSLQSSMTGITYIALKIISSTLFFFFLWKFHQRLWELNIGYS